MRLSPVLVATLAIAAPLGGCESANAQITDSLSQALTVNSYSVLTAKPEVIAPSTMPTIAQTPKTKPNQIKQPSPTSDQTESRVLVSEVLIKSQTGLISPELENQIYRVIRTQAGRITTRSQLQEDINAIFATGFFAKVQATPEDTPLGVRVSFVVQPNPVLTKVQIQANSGTNVSSVLPAETVNKIFSPQYGKIINLRELQDNIKQLTKQYQEKGYVLANVIGAPQVSKSGVITLQVAEGVVKNIQVRFRNKDGQDTDDKGKPIRGRTQDYIIIFIGSTSSISDD